MRGFDWRLGEIGQEVIKGGLDGPGDLWGGFDWGHNFSVPGSIAPKISSELPQTLAMPLAKFHANW